jgi:hypothetical protein
MMVMFLSFKGDARHKSERSAEITEKKPAVNGVASNNKVPQRHKNRQRGALISCKTIVMAHDQGPSR